MKLLHHFDLHEYQVLLVLLVQVNIFDCNFFARGLVGGERDNSSSSSAELLLLQEGIP